MRAPKTDKFTQNRAALQASRDRGQRSAVSLYRVGGEVLPLQAIAERVGADRSIVHARIRRARQRNGAVTWEDLA